VKPVISGRDNRRKPDPALGQAADARSNSGTRLIGRERSFVTTDVTLAPDFDLTVRRV
jgi:hypothetical protein